MIGFMKGHSNFNLLSLSSSDSSSPLARDLSKAFASKKKAVKKTVKKSSAKKTKKTTAKKSPASKTATKKTSTPPDSKKVTVKVKMRSSRKVTALKKLAPVEREARFESIESKETIDLFDKSYPSELVNLLLTVKPQSVRQMFLQVLKFKKKAYIEFFILYYYREYLRDPLPLTVPRVPSKDPMPNYYALLGVSRDSTQDEILEAGKYLLKAFKEDSFPKADRKQAEKNIQEIKEAFNILKNEEKRKEVDCSLPSMNYLYPPRDRLWGVKLSRLLAERV